MPETFSKLDAADWPLLKKAVTPTPESPNRPPAGPPTPVPATKSVSAPKRNESPTAKLPAAKSIVSVLDTPATVPGVKVTSAERIPLPEKKLGPESPDPSE